MKSGRRTHFLLALAFALGQWFAVVHATQHELSSADRLVACEVCAVGHAAATPPPAAAAGLVFAPGIETPLARPTAAPRRNTALRPPTRGPPSILV